MSTKVEAPKPTKEENALRSEQTELLRQQREILVSQQNQQKALMPIFAKQLGLNLKFDKAGNIIGASQIPDPKGDKIAAMQQQVLEKTLADLLKVDPLDPARQRVEKLLLERSEKALKGELPVDPALERDITSQRDTLQNRLREQFGSGFDTSTPGIEAMQRFEESAEVLRSGARRGELTLAEQLSMARQGLGQQEGQAGINSGGFAFNVGQGQLQGAMAQRAQLGQILGQPLGIAGGLGQVAGGFQMPIGQLQHQRQMEFDADIANAQSSMGGLGAIGGIFGSLFSALPF